MDSKRLLTGTIVGGVLVAAMGFLIYEVILAGFFEGQTMVTPRDAPIWWATIVSALAHGLLLTLVIGWAGGSSAMDGLKTGAVLGLLLWFGADMILYALMEYSTLAGAIGDSIGAAVQYGVAGAAVGMAAGKSPEATPTAL